MKTWQVTIPIEVTDAVIEVEAETAEEAIAFALSEDGFTNEHFTWREDEAGATAECLDGEDDESDDE